MGALAQLEPRTLPATPGGQAEVELRVRNSGTVVDQFTIDVLGDAHAWAAVTPPTLSLFPGSEETARITFSPPRSPLVPAGPLAFGIRVQSKEDPAGSVVEEGTLEIAPFSEVSAELVPRTSRASMGATHDLAIDNRGNTPLNAALAAVDPDRLLSFDVRPPAVFADPGTAVFAKVGVRPRRRFWRGPAQTRPFRVQLETPEGMPVGIDGTLLQEAILPPWTIRALMTLLGLLLALILAWLFLVRPAIESTAREQTEDVLAAFGLTPPPATPGGGNGPGPGPTQTDGNGDGSPSPSPPAGGSPSPPVLAGVGELIDGRIEADGDPFVGPEGKHVFITDLVFSNPNDALTGDILLQRAGNTLLVLQLQNFRDLDFHFVTPVGVLPGQELRLVCQTPGACPRVAVYYSGYQRPP